MNNKIRELAQAAGFKESDGFSMDEKLNEFARLLLREVLIEIDSDFIAMKQKGWDDEANGVELAYDTVMSGFGLKHSTTSMEFVKWEEENETN